MKIGLISDTHSFLDPKVFDHFGSCDEIWHVGDFGDPEVLDALKNFKPTKGVYGNIDGQKIRVECPEKLIFEIEGVKVYMVHIGGTPPRYAKGVRQDLLIHKPDLFICGHSHILKVVRDHSLNLLYMNPGAAGRHGFHKIRTILRFDIDSGSPKNLEVIELGSRSK